MTSLPSLGARFDASSFGAASPVRPSSPADTSVRSWFDGIAGQDRGLSSLRAEAEPGARGLSAAQHAERVLQHVVEPA
jgi:hypothetical protein